MPTGAAWQDSLKNNYYDAGGINGEKEEKAAFQHAFLISKFLRKSFQNLTPSLYLEEYNAEKRELEGGAYA